MAKRLALSIAKLRDLHPAACESDMRVLMKEGDSFNLSIDMRGERVQLNYCGTRELRLLAKQIEWFADYLDAIDQPEPLEEFDHG